MCDGAHWRGGAEAGQGGQRTRLLDRLVATPPTPGRASCRAECGLCLWAGACGLLSIRWVHSAERDSPPTCETWCLSSVVLVSVDVGAASC